VNDARRDDRARLYPLLLALRFRQLGRKRWSKATTENISYSGVLFRPGKSMKPDTPIEMRMALPKAVAGEPPATLMCQGRIVRVLPHESENKRPGLAARITEFHFVRDRKK
jgi:hypothetical protein